VKLSEDDLGLSAANLTVDGTDFDALPPKSEPDAETNVCISREDLQIKYGISLPYKAQREPVRHASEPEVKGSGWCCNNKPIRQRQTRVCC